jgi:hypothetical protein
VHPLYEYCGSEDPTSESTRNLTCDKVDWWLVQLFDMASYKGLAEVMRAYKLCSPRLQVNSMTPYCFEHLFPTVLLIPPLICARLETTGESMAGVDRPQQTHVRHQQKATEHVEPVSASSNNSGEEGENPEPHLMRQTTRKCTALEGPS